MQVSVDSRKFGVDAGDRTGYKAGFDLVSGESTFLILYDYFNIFLSHGTEK